MQGLNVTSEKRDAGRQQNGKKRFWVRLHKRECHVSLEYFSSSNGSVKRVLTDTESMNDSALIYLLVFPQYPFWQRNNMAESSWLVNLVLQIKPVGICWISAEDILTESRCRTPRKNVIGIRLARDYQGTLIQLSAFDTIQEADDMSMPAELWGFYFVFWHYQLNVRKPHLACKTHCADDLLCYRLL